MNHYHAYPYTDQFYKEREALSLQSARVLAPLIYALCRPNTVVDVGCGTGTWLKVFTELGASDCFGLDAPHFNPDLLVIPQDHYTAIDLENCDEPPRRFDLALCLEVAEHVSAPSAPALVRYLCLSAPIVVFSAAIPGQGGTGHVNERWPVYWAGLFREHNYSCFDIFRPRLWNNPKIAWWYAQNTLLFVDTSAIIKKRDPAHAPLTALVEQSGGRREIPLSLVHPEKYLQAVALSRKAEKSRIHSK